MVLLNDVWRGFHVQLPYDRWCAESSWRYHAECICGAGDRFHLQLFSGDLDVAARFNNPSFACTDGVTADSTCRGSPQVDMIGQLWHFEKHNVGGSDNIQPFLEFNYGS